MGERIDANIRELALGAATTVKGPTLDVTDDHVGHVAIVRIRLGRLRTAALAAAGAELGRSATVAPFRATYVDGAALARRVGKLAAFGLCIALGGTGSTTMRDRIEAALGRCTKYVSFCPCPVCHCRLSRSISSISVNLNSPIHRYSRRSSRMVLSSYIVHPRAACCSAAVRICGPRRGSKWLSLCWCLI